MRLRVLSLFSGIGGFDLGLERAGMRIVGQVEIEDFPTKILEKHWPKVKRWRDIRNVTVNDIRRGCGRIDVICGGFPCQDISTAGTQLGVTDGERSGLWREMWRLVRDLRPDWVFFENVPALRTKGADTVIAAYEAIGYACWPVVVAGRLVGANHRRKRVLCIGANTNSNGFDRLRRSGLLDREWTTFGDNTNGCSSAGICAKEARTDASSDGIRKQSRRGNGASGRKTSIASGTGQKIGANANGTRHEGKGCNRQARFAESPYYRPNDWEEPRTIKSKMDLAIYGLSRGLVGPAVKACGNAVIPQIVELFGNWIVETHNKGER